jgi:gliding motility-associated-like protein
MINITMLIFCRNNKLSVAVALLFSFISLSASTKKINPLSPSCATCQIRFTENKNQWDREILFLNEMRDGNIILEKNGLIFNFWNSKFFEDLNYWHHQKGLKKEIFFSNENVLKGHIYRIKFLNANPDPKIVSHDPFPGYTNYFLGNDKSKWASKVKDFNKVSYENLYSNISMDIYGQNSTLKYDFIVNPGGNPSEIKLEYSGADQITIKDGNLMIKTSVKEIIEKKPYAFQLKQNQRITVPCNFVLSEEVINASSSDEKFPVYFLTFEFPEGYDTTEALIIDPELVFASYSGSTANNFGFTATFDQHGHSYNGGITFNSFTGSFPVSIGAYQQSFSGGEFDISIIKFDDTKVGNEQRLYATYLGGTSTEFPHSLIVNDNNELVIMGTTGSNNFPVTSGAFDTSFNGGTPTTAIYLQLPQGSDIFVSLLSEDGTELKASTYIGGSANDGLNLLLSNYGDEARGDIIVDADNNYYIVTSTSSHDFPVTSGSFQTVSGGGIQAGCIFKFDTNLSTLLWGSYLGGSGVDAVYSVAIDSEGNLFVAGGTTSQDFPVSGTALFSSHSGKLDGFVTHISATGASILMSSFIGSAAGEDEQCFFVQLDQQDNVYLLGQTSDYLRSFIINSEFNVENASNFIMKLNKNLQNILFSTTFGDNKMTPMSPTAFLVDKCNNIYACGWGNVSEYPLSQDAHDNIPDQGEPLGDFYLMVMDKDASSLLYATFYGKKWGSSGEHVDGGTSRFDKKGVVYHSVCGGCRHSLFPENAQTDSLLTTPGAFSRTNKSEFGCNQLAFKFDFQLPVLQADFDFNISTICMNDTLYFEAVQYFQGTVFNWQFGDGATSDQPNPFHIYAEPGTYEIVLTAYNAFACNPTDSIKKKVIVGDNNITSFAGNDSFFCTGQSLQIGMSPLEGITYEWFPATGLNDSNISNPTASPSETTTYILTASRNGCSIKDTIVLTIKDVEINLNKNAFICVGDSVQIGIDYEPGNTYLWDPSYGLSNNLISNPVAFPDTTTLYYLSVDNGGCIGSDSLLFKVFPFSDVLDFNENVQFYCDKTVVKFTPNIAASEFLWNLGDGNISSDFVPVHEYALGLPFLISLKTLSEDNCGYIEKSFTFEDGLNIYMPNVFTPNGDNQNDCFQILTSEADFTDCYEVKIFNRWGMLLFESINPDDCWNGKVQRKDVDAVEGIYYYTVRIRNSLFNGFIHLIR